MPCRAAGRSRGTRRRRRGCRRPDRRRRTSCRSPARSSLPGAGGRWPVVSSGCRNGQPPDRGFERHQAMVEFLSEVVESLRHVVLGRSPAPQRGAELCRRAHPSARRSCRGARRSCASVRRALQSAVDSAQASVDRVRAARRLCPDGFRTSPARPRAAGACVRSHSAGRSSSHSSRASGRRRYHRRRRRKEQSQCPRK